MPRKSPRLLQDVNMTEEMELIGGPKDHEKHVRVSCFESARSPEFEALPMAGGLGECATTGMWRPNFP